MWTCQYCGEEVEHLFTECWNCGKEKPGFFQKINEELPLSTESPDDQYIRVVTQSYRQARALLQQGLSTDQIIQTIQTNGLLQEDARDLLEEFVTEIRAGKKEMIVGGSLVAVGLLSTIISYVSAVVNGRETYAITSGAILFGIVFFFKGLVKWSHIIPCGVQEREHK